MADINVTNEIIDVNVTEEVITVAVNSGAYPLPSNIISVFGRTGTVTANEGDYSLTQLGDVTLTSPANGQILKYNGTNWVNTTIGDYVPYTGATSDLNLGTNNIYTNNLFEKFVSLTASGTQLVLTVSSAPSIVVSGSGGQTIKLPDATTLPNGATYYFNNNQSSGVINVNNNSNTLVKSAQSGSYLIITLLDNSIAAGSWDAHFEAPSNASWSTNTFDYAGSITNATWNGTTIAINRGGTGATTAGAALTNLGGIGLTSLSATTPLSYNNTTGVFTISQASASSNGYLASGDFNTFNGKQGAITLTTTGTSGAATLVGNTLNIPQYGGSAISGSGTTNTLPKFTGSTAIGNSNITDSGTLISLGSDTTISSGGLGIGTSTLTGYSLNVAKNITGATTSYGIRSQGTIQSDVTVLVASYASILNTAAASFTLTDYVQYRAMQGTIGAGSVVTNQYGYYVDSSMTGATNNYGFYGNIASGANRWNLYMSGTAFNYLEGKTLIGTSTDSGYKLDVNGTTRINNTTTVNNGALNVVSSSVGSGTFIIAPTHPGANSAITLDQPNKRIILSIGNSDGGLIVQRPTQNDGESRLTSSTNNVSLGYFAFNNTAGRLVTFPSTGSLLLGTSVDITTSILTLTSTTRGFLPPRMTTTQKNAISSPNAGLMVYDTTLNKLCVYTTAWETITSV